MDRRKLDVVLSTFLIIISVIILTNDNLADGGAESDLGILFLPRVVAGVMIVFSAMIAFQALLKLARSEKPEGVEIVSTDGFGGIFIYVAIFVLYWLAVPYVGFMITTPTVMIAVALLLGGRNFIAIGAVSIVTPILIFYCSREFLRVYLPTWSL